VLANFEQRKHRRWLVDRRDFLPPAVQYETRGPRVVFPDSRQTYDLLAADCDPLTGAAIVCDPLAGEAITNDTLTPAASTCDTLTPAATTDDPLTPTGL